jgi:hypothetical protein
MTYRRNFFSDPNPDPHFLSSLPSQAPFQGFIWLLGTAGKLPQPSQQAMVGPADDEQLSTLVLNNSCRYVLVWDGTALSTHW